MSSFCEKCQSRSMVLDSRHDSSTGIIRRRRKCLKCKFRWSTIEVNTTTKIYINRIGQLAHARRLVNEGLDLMGKLI